MDLHDITEILGLIISICGVVITILVFVFGRSKKQKTLLAEQVIAYYCLQDEAIKWIQELNPNAKEKTVKEELRKRAQNNEKNIKKIYPNMTIKKAEEYL